MITQQLVSRVTYTALQRVLHLAYGTGANIMLDDNRYCRALTPLVDGPMQWLATPKLPTIVCNRRFVGAPKGVHTVDRRSRSARGMKKKAHKHIEATLIYEIDPAGLRLQTVTVGEAPPSREGIVKCSRIIGYHLFYTIS